MLIFILPVKVSPCSQTQHMVGPTNLIASAAVISSLCSFFFHHSIAFSFSFPLLSQSRFRVCARDMTGRHEAAAELPLRARRVQGDNGGLRAPPPPLPTLILSARRGRPRAERRRREERHAAMGGAEHHAAVGERSTAGGPSGARGRLVAVGYVSVREFPASLLQGYADTPWIRIPAVSQAYPCRIRIRHGIRTLPAVSVFLRL